jgi:hypothetical protein
MSAIFTKLPKKNKKEPIRERDDLTSKSKGHGHADDVAGVGATRLPSRCAVVVTGESSARASVSEEAFVVIRPDVVVAGWVCANEVFLHRPKQAPAWASTRNAEARQTERATRPGAEGGARRRVTSRHGDVRVRVCVFSLQRASAAYPSVVRHHLKNTLYM